MGTPKMSRFMSGVKITNSPVIRPQLVGVVSIKPNVWSTYARANTIPTHHPSTKALRPLVRKTVGNINRLAMANRMAKKGMAPYCAVGFCITVNVQPQTAVTAIKSNDQNNRDIENWWLVFLTATLHS
jgi:hypothetical protein